jgi:hypothetical protein
MAPDDQEEVVGLIVLVPHERSFDLDHLQLVVVDMADDAWLIGLIEERELRCQVDLLADDVPPCTSRVNASAAP